MDTDTVRQIVAKKEDFLRRHLVLSETVVEKLGELGVIGEYAKRQLVADKGNSQKQLNVLLFALKCRGLVAFRGFLDVLRQTCHGWIADDILATPIDTESKTGTGNTTTLNVSDIVNRSYESSVPFGPVFRDYNGLPVLPYALFQPPGGHGNHAFGYGREYRRRRRDSDVRNDSDVFNSRKVLSPIAKVPENIRYLQSMFEKETASTQKSLTVLRNEENTIKSLLQQNVREQKQALSRQEALVEIRDRIKQINSRTTQLYKPRVDTDRARTRLRKLQRMSQLDAD